MRALAHPARRAIVEHCLLGPHAAGQLVPNVGLAPASVSEHLKVLRKAGLLALDRRGRHWVYRTDAGVLGELGERIAAMARTGS